MAEPSSLHHSDSSQAMLNILSAYNEPLEEDAAEEGGAKDMDISESDDEKTETPIPNQPSRDVTPKETTNTAQQRGVERTRTLDITGQNEWKTLDEIAADSDDGIRKTMKRKKDRLERRLVSYGPDDIDEDEERGSQGSEVESEEDNPNAEVQYASTGGSDLNLALSHGVSILPEDDVTLPPEPTGKCSNKLQKKITEKYEQMLRLGFNTNVSIQRRKDFRNPSICEKLIDYCAIDEKGTNYSPEAYYPGIYGPESQYEELARVQKEDMDRRERERKERTKVEFVSGTKKSAAADSPEQTKRSKWDTQMMSSTSVTTSSVSAGTASSAKTVISAVGAIKKPK